MNRRIRRGLARLPVLAARLPSYLMHAAGARARQGSSRIAIIAPDANWAIDRVSQYITQGIAREFNEQIQTTVTNQFLAGHLLHYGSLGAFVDSLGSVANQKNSIVMTIFHGDRRPEFPELKASVERFVEHAALPQRIVTASSIMEQRLQRWGIAKGKIVRIPIGVDLSHFTPASDTARQALRQKLSIPEGAICIGSFQKDGNGWGEGLTPKLIKGPDVFLTAIEQLHKRHSNLFVLLTGPARGYVKQGLEALKVPYLHHQLDDYLDIVDYYRCLDLYLVTSREEGGPKAILESMATHVPIVSTRVGMAPDIIEHGVNGFMVESEDVNSIVDCALEIIQEPRRSRKIIARARESTSEYGWPQLAIRYYLEVYQPVLEEMDRMSKSSFSKFGQDKANIVDATDG